MNIIVPRLREFCDLDSGAGPLETYIGMIHLEVSEHA